MLELIYSLFDVLNLVITIMTENFLNINNYKDVKNFNRISISLLV